MFVSQMVTCLSSFAQSWAWRCRDTSMDDTCFATTVGEAARSMWVHYDQYFYWSSDERLLELSDPLPADRVVLFLDARPRTQVTQDGGASG